MTIKQIIVGSLIGSTVVGIALHKMYREKGSLLLARWMETTHETPQTASASLKQVPNTRLHQDPASVG